MDGQGEMFNEVTTRHGEFVSSRLEPSEGTIPSDAYNGSPPHEEGSDTSRAAAHSVAPITGKLRRTVYDHIASCRRGATDDEIEQALSLRHQTASARRRELVLSGHVEDSGMKRHTTSGRLAVVWKAT